MVTGRADPDGELSPVALELRVHGVHNTPPTSMLGIEKGDLAQVAGDGLTGFYRSRSGQLPYREPKAGLAVEAYSWGALTSGARGFFGWVQRALWLLLLPFALANMAYWARLGLARRTLDSRLGASAVRVSSLLLTLFFVTVVATIFVDLVGWQCYRGGESACPGMPGWFDWLASRRPGQRLAICALVPLVAVLVSALLTNKSLARYEGVDDPTRDDMAPMPAPAAGSGTPRRGRPREDWILRHPDLWNGAVRTRILRDAHLGAAMAMLVLFLSLHVLVVSVDEKSTHGWRLGYLALLVAAGVLLVAALALTCVTLPQDLEPQLVGSVNDREQMWVRCGQVVVWVAFAVTVATLLVLYLTPPGTLGELNDFYGRNAWFSGIFLALTSMHLFVFAGGRMQGWARFVVPALLPAWLAVGYVVVRYIAWGGDKEAGTRSAHAAALVWLVAVAGFVLLAIWHYSLGRDTRLRTEEAVASGHRPAERDASLAGSAFAGAGASVLLAAGVWTALLFSTAAVVGTANELNGSAGVTRLRTVLPPREVPQQVAKGDQARGRPDLTVSGPVVLSGAVYQLIDNRLTVYSGTVTVTGAWRGRPTSGTTPLKALPDGEALTVATMALPVKGKGKDAAAYVDVQKSCDYGAAVAKDPRRGPGGFVCQTSDGFGYAPSMLRRAPLKELSIAAPARTVQLDLRKPGYTPLVVPSVMVWAPVAQTLWLLVVGVVVGWCLFRFRHARREIVEDAPSYRKIPATDRAGAQAARASAALAHRAERILDLVGFVTSPLALAVIVFSALRRPPWKVLGHIHLLADLSVYVVLGMAAALILLGSKFRSSDSVRRAVGVIWDLATFWPRAAHPLAPPCYSERVVPEISRRVMWALDTSGSRHIVLSGHSQGSLIVATVAARLDDLHRIRIITYGSQVRALYGRFFPAVFGADVVGYRPTTGPVLLNRAWPDVRTAPTGVWPAPHGSLRAQLASPGHWVNLFRRTDPLGFRVFSDADSGADVATLEVPIRAMGDPGPPIKGHSDYQHTPEYRRQLKRWTHESYVGPPATTTEVGPLPAP